MAHPNRIGSDLRAILQKEFTARQIVELTLDVAAWNTQKIAVALGADRPIDEHRLSALTFDDRGRSVIDGRRWQGAGK